MRVLQVITDTDRRGAQVFACELGSALAGAGHSVTTVALAVGSAASPLDVPVLGTRPRSVATIRAIRRLGREHDVCIAHGGATLMACALAGIPFVYRQISDTRFWASGWPRRLRVAAFLRRALHVVALSPTAAEALTEHVWVSKRRISVVPNGVPMGDFAPTSPAQRRQHREAHGLSPEAFLVLSMGALSSEKDVGTAVRAVAGMEGVELLVVGSGPEHDRLRRMAGGEVRFLPATDQPATFYAMADAFVLPSRSESMPASLIEAGLSGLPCIATPVGSVTDVLVPERTGIIVPVGDHVALRHAIERLRDQAGLAANFGAAARQHCAEHFEIGRVAAQWEAVLQRVARASRRSRP